MNLFKKYSWQILALLLALAITFGLAVWPSDWKNLDFEKLKNFGYPGLLVVTLLSNATVLIPFPGLAFVFLAGGFLNPIPIGLVSGLGSTLGELTGYLVGFGGSALIEENKNYLKIKKWMTQNGFLTIFVLALIPSPLFDLGGAAAGALKFPLWKFLLACFLGKTIKFSLIAWAGSASLDFIKPWLGL